MLKVKDSPGLSIHGHVTVAYRDTGEVLVDRDNAIHPGNFATALARGLANSDRHQIYKLKLGNQGTYIDTSQQIVYRPPNVSGVTTPDPNADLYNATYVEVVDDQSASVGSGNSVTFTNIPSSTSTRVIVTCVVSPSEAVNRPDDGASTADPLPGPDPVATLDPESQYFFDELGLFTQGTGSPSLLNEDEELMLSHLIFSPIEHTGSRELVITYSITLTVS
jgi:hypothetical protein